MTQLDEMVEPLKREVAIPGTFDTVYPNTTDTDLEGSLGDAFGAAQIDGFFLNQTLDLDTGTIEDDLSMAGMAVVTIYAAERILTMQIMSLKQRVNYEAGPVKYETENAASVMTEILKGLKARRAAISASAAAAGRVNNFIMQDMYADRATNTEGLFVGSATFYDYELAGY